MALIKSPKLQPAIFLMGPTAAGKTELSLALAERLPVEIISVDSAMVYQGMDIGTGKPTVAERSSVPHHLIDIRDPSERYSAAEFANDALELMHAISERGCIPVLVGGTLLYFRALREGLSSLPAANMAVRQRLLAEATVIGWAAMHQRLMQVDAVSASRIHPNDPQRIQRALEVYEVCARPLSSFFAETSSNQLLQKKRGQAEIRSIEEYQLFSFAVMPCDRQVLHQRIAERFQSMLAAGLVEEVTGFFNRGDLTLDLPAMRSVGYRQIWRYLAGEYGYDDMTLKSMAATRQLAKRQLTWLRSLSDIKWLQNTHLASMETVIHCLS